MDLVREEQLILEKAEIFPVCASVFFFKKKKEF